MTVIWSGTVDVAWQRAQQRPAPALQSYASRSQQVVAYLEQQPATLREIAAGCGIDYGAAGNVLGGLLRGGYVEPTGQSTQVAGGRPARVYRAREKP